MAHNILNLNFQIGGYQRIRKGLFPGLWIGVRRFDPEGDFKKHDQGALMDRNVWMGGTKDQFGISIGLLIGLDLNCVLINAYNHWEIKHCDSALEKYPFVCQRKRDEVF